MKCWDKNIDFGETYNRLLRLIRYNAEIDRPLYLAYLSILSVCLVNGARISEGCLAFQEFLETGNRHLFIKVSKRRDGARRLIIIPNFIKDEYKHQILSASIRMPFVPNLVYCFSTRHLDLNPHSLRYSFVRLLLKHHVDHVVISSILGHKKLETIMSYSARLDTTNLLSEFVSLLNFEK
jgi:integrase